MIRIHVRQRIKELRIDKGISQEKFAIEAGLDRTYITSIESGKRNVSIVSLAKIWNALGITGKEFFDSPIFSGEIK